MKRFAVLTILALSLTACGTMSRSVGTPHSVAQNAAAAVTHMGGDSSSPVPGLGALATRLLGGANIWATPGYIEQAQKALAIASPSDTIFRTCIQTKLDIGQALKQDPIIIPDITPTDIDPTCPLCLLAIKRRVADDIISGAFMARLQTQQARINELRKRHMVGCAALYAEEASLFH